MKTFCKYHPTKAAHFYCPACGDHYCPDCIDEKRTGALGSTVSRHCIRCDTEVEWVGVTNLIEPLTSRISKIFLYGFSGWPLALSILLCLGQLVFSLPSIYFLIMRLVLFAVLVKYSFAVLRATARGNLSPPAAWGESATGDFGPVFKQFLIFVVVGAVAAYLAGRGGAALGQVFLIASIVFLPAMIIVLAATDSMLAALNPVLFGPLAFRVGQDYLLMAFFLTILFAGPNALRPLLAQVPGGSLLLLFAFHYYMIIAYHLMGYVILLHHRDIGYEVRYDDFKDLAAPAGAGDKSPQQRLLARANVMIKEGAADDALTLILAKTRYEDMTDTGLALCFFNLVKLKKRADLLRDRGPELFRVFYAAKRRKEASDAYAAVAAADPSFSPGPDELFAVAGWLSESGRYAEALNAYSRFIKANPGHERLVAAYFTSARLLNERLGKPAKAREVLAWLEKKYPRHELAGQVRSYRAKISPSAPAPSAPPGP